MTKPFLIVLCAACSPAWAQTPATNPMPDGSRDMYVGLGVQSAPRWDGAAQRKVSALPVVQVQWSNGLFVSGLSAGLHLSADPTVEYGPLLALQPGRDETGNGRAADGVDTSLLGPVPDPLRKNGHGTRLEGLDKIGTRLQAGLFANVYPTPQWRITSSVLVGGGIERGGARLDLGVQRLAITPGAQHRVALSAGVGIVNRKLNAAWFGVTPAEAARSRFDAYAPGGGLQDARVGVRWHWSWSPAWMLTSHLEAQRLLGSAAASPLVERSTGITVSTAIAYRF